MAICSLDIHLYLFGNSLFFMSSSKYCFMTYIQISQVAGQVIWYSHDFKNFLVFLVVYIVKGFGIVNKAEIDVFFVCLFVCSFLELSCFIDDPVNIGNLISGSSAFSKYFEQLEFHGSCTVEAWLGEF